MRNKILAGAGWCGAVALAVMMSGETVLAQTPMTESRAAVAACLCAQQDLRILGHRLRAERQRYDESRSNAQALEQQVASSRGTVNIDDRSNIEAFKALVERRDAAQQAYVAESVHYNAAVQRYNDAVSRNNSACTGHDFNEFEVSAVRATLACPRP
jgi:hypothetical protein